MSRVGNKTIPVPSGVRVGVAGRRVDVTGPLGALNWSVPSSITVVSGEDGAIRVTRRGDGKTTRALHGLSRALIANMVEGVSKGFERKLEIYGTGYGCSVAGRKLHLNIGFMGRGGKNKPQFEIDIPPGVDVEIVAPASRGDTDPAKMTVKGCDKQAVGHFAASVRKLRPPEPYKGKGVRYENEHVRRKQGKALAGAAR